MLKKLVVSLILVALVLGVAAPALAAPAAAPAPTTGELVELAKTRVAGAQSGLEAAKRADSLAQAAVWARKDAVAFQTTAESDLATLRRAVAAIPALPVASAATPTTDGLNIEDLVKVLETISTTSFVDPTARVYAVENAKSALSRARNSTAEAARWNSRAATLEQDAQAAYQQAKGLLLPAATTAAPAMVAPAVVAPSAAPAQTTAGPTAAEVQLRKERDQANARADKAERERDTAKAALAAAPAPAAPIAPATTAPAAAPAPAVAPSATVAPATAPAATSATPAATVPAPAAPAPVAPAVAPAVTPAPAPAAATVAPSTTTEPMATKDSVDQPAARVTKVESTVGVNDLAQAVKDLTAVTKAQTAEIAGLRSDLERTQAQLRWTWIGLATLLLIGLLFVAGVYARRVWTARQVARRETEDEAARRAAATAGAGTPPTIPVNPAANPTP